MLAENATISSFHFQLCSLLGYFVFNNPPMPKIVVARKQSEASSMSFQWVNKSMRSHPLEVARRNLPLLLNSLVLSSAFETLPLISSWLF